MRTELVGAGLGEAATVRSDCQRLERGGMVGGLEHFAGAGIPHDDALLRAGIATSGLEREEADQPLLAQPAKIADALQVPAVELHGLFSRGVENLQTQVPDPLHERHPAALGAGGGCERARRLQRKC